MSAEGSATRYRSQLAIVATSELRQRYPGLEIVGMDQSLEIIEGEDLVPSLGYLVDHSWDIDPRETEAVIAIGAALDSDYLLQLHSRHDAWMDTGTWSTEQEGEDQSFFVRGYIWSTSDGKKVWHGTGNVLSETGAYAKSSDVQDLLMEAVRSLIARLPIGVAPTSSAHPRGFPAVTSSRGPDVRGARPWPTRPER